MWRQQCLRGTTALLYGTWVVWRLYGSKYLSKVFAAETAEKRSLDLAVRNSTHTKVWL